MRAHVEALAQVVAHHDERATLALLLDQLIEDVHGVRIKAGIRLVQKHHVGVVDQSAGDGQALRHAARERAHHVKAAMLQLDGLEQLHDARLRICQPIKLRIQKQVLLGGKVGIEHGVMRDKADAPASRFGVFPQVDAHKACRAVGRARERGQHAQQRGLAGAVGAEYGKERPLRNLDGHLVHRLARAEHLRQLPCPDGSRFLHRPPFPCILDAYEHSHASLT